MKYVEEPKGKIELEEFQALIKAEPYGKFFVESVKSWILKRVYQRSNNIKSWGLSVTDRHKLFTAMKYLNDSGDLPDRKIIFETGGFWIDYKYVPKNDSKIYVNQGENQKEGCKQNCSECDYFF